MPAPLKESARMISGLQPRLHQTSLKSETKLFFARETPIFFRQTELLLQSSNGAG
jgi:hypothetical protein